MQTAAKWGERRWRRSAPVDRGTSVSTTAIVAATLELLEDRGYNELSLTAVAERADTTTAAIYRRWGTKSALVAHAVFRTDGDEVVADTGDLANDLATMVRWSVKKIYRPVALTAIGGLLGESRTDRRNRVTDGARASPTGRRQARPGAGRRRAARRHRHQPAGLADRRTRPARRVRRHDRTDRRGMDRRAGRPSSSTAPAPPAPPPPKPTRRRKEAVDEADHVARPQRLAPRRRPRGPARAHATHWSASPPVASAAPTSPTCTWA